VCHGCAFLGQALFRDFSKHGKSSKKSSSSSPTKQAILSKEQFIAGSQKIMQLIGDEQLLSFYIKVRFIIFLIITSLTENALLYYNKFVFIDF